MNRNIWWLCALIVSFVTGCSQSAVLFTPEKLPSTIRSPAAEQADAVFWNTLHDGQYNRIESALNALTAAYLNDPSDATTAAHIGWLHIWRLAGVQLLHRRLCDEPPAP